MESIINLFYHGYLSNTVISLFLGFLFLVVTYWNGMRRYAISKKLNIPGPKPLPYVGNLLEIRRHGGIAKYQLECLKKYGKVFAIWSPNLSIVVADPEILKQILVKRFENFSNRFSHMHNSRAVLSVSTARGEDWKRLRHTLTPNFTAVKIKLMVPLMEKASDTLVSKLESVADKGKSVDMPDLFSQMAFDVILMTAFGTESDVQTNLNSEFFKLTRTLISTHGPVQLLLKLIPFGKFLAPLLEKFYFYWYPSNPMNVMNTLAQTAIHARKEELKKGISGRKDLLELMLTAEVSEGVKKLSDEEISAQAISFLFAGHHTTSRSLANIVYHLSMNPDVQEKLRGEIKSAVQENPEMSIYDLVNNIEYLDCVFKEAQRLLPIGQNSFVNRECAEACDINGVHFPAGVEVVVKPFLLHHDPDAWPDVNKFNSERKMESISNLYDLSNGYLSKTVLSLFLGFFFFVATYWNGMRRFSILKKLNIPGPKPLPYIGNILEMWKHGGIVNYQLECMKKYGKVFVICTPNPSIVVADPEMLRQIMVKMFENFTNRFTHVQTSRTGLGVDSARDEDWKRLRHTLSPTFTAVKLKLMVAFMEKASDTLARKLEGVADTGKSVDIRDWFSRMALDVILMTAFGTESDVQNNCNSDFFNQCKASIETHGPLQLLLNLVPFGKFFSLSLEKFFLYWYSTHDPVNVLVKLAQTAVRSRQEELKKGITGRKDLLQLMLTAHDSERIKKLSDEEISAQSVTFLFAGQHITSESLTNIVYHLSMNPDMQEKLRGEIESAVKKNAEMSMYDLANSIEYLDCIFSEGQRLSPLKQNSFVNRECAKSCDINGTHFPAGVEVVINPTLLHLDTDAWSDVNEFDPERHRGPAKKSRHPNQFMPFGDGPRHCIGKRFSLLAVKLTMTKLMRKFRFVREPNVPVTPSSVARELHILIESV